MTSRRTAAVATAAALVAMIAVGGTITLGVSVSQLAASNAALRSQIESLGETPVAPPAIGEAGDPGPTGPPGPPGDDGDDGEPGRPPTSAEVQAAVALYCASRGACIGPSGSNGTNGVDGANGTNGADGAPGTPGADSTVPGPQGPPGPAGPTCPEGYTLELVWLIVSTEETGPPERQQAAVCRLTPTEGSTTP